MKRKQKLGTLCLCALLLFGLAACGQTAATQDGTESPAAETPAAESPAAETPANEAPTAPPEDLNRLKLNLDEEYQTMIGIGAGFTWYSDSMLVNADYRDEMADLLFRDAKLSILRFKNEYGYRGDSVSMVCREAQIYELAAERLAEIGETPTVLMSCWSPPATLKSNDRINGGGTLKKNDDGTYMYEEYGAWWADAVAAYEDAGVPIDYISIQNECDFQVSYDGMELAQFETEKEAAYSKAFLATYDALQAKLGGDAPLMLGPETMTAGTTALRMYLKDILESRPETLAGVAFHLYQGGTSQDVANGSTNQPESFNLTFMDTVSAFGDDYPLWQTEFYRGTPMQTAKLINNSLVYGNLNAYVYWTGVWTGSDYSHDIITVGTNGKYGYASTYWVIRHYSEFIRPGYIRVGLGFPYGSYNASAFKSPDGSKLVVILVNDSEADAEVTLPLEGYTVSDSAIYQTVLADDAYGTGEYYNELGALSGDNSLLLKARSITTVDISGTAG